MGMARRSMRRTARRTSRRVARRQSAFAEGAPEEQEAQENTEQAPPASDPVQKLKERLANGEITLEEYNQMLEAITK
jgi:hypothetical protein